MKTTLILIALLVCGCTPNGPPWIDRKPQPVVPVTPAVQTLRIEVGGDGRITVGGDATITAQPAKTAGVGTDACPGGCGRPGCGCLRSSAAAGAVRPRAVASLPEVRIYGQPGHPEYDAAMQSMAQETGLPFRVIPAEPPVWATGPIVFHWQAHGGEWKQRAAWDGVGPFVEMWRKSRLTPPASIPRASSHWTFPGNSRSDLIEHLQAGEHRGHFSASYLAGLSFSELKQLHSADHEGRVSSRSIACPGGFCPTPTPNQSSARQRSTSGRFLFWSW